VKYPDPSDTGGGKLECIEFPERESWRAWLAANHDCVQEIWLVFRKVSTGIAVIPYEDAVEEALCFGWVDSIVRRLDDLSYARKFTPRRPGSVWSAINKARAGRMIAEERMTPAGMALVDEARASGEWGMERGKPVFPLEEVPPELALAMTSDPEAERFFDSLPSSCRRQYILWIVSAKKPETKQRRAAEAARLLAAGRRLGLK
jgi:uncharacterized protein YdeI (YjbR/CyaY-like superfamily)